MQQVQHKQCTSLFIYTATKACQALGYDLGWAVPGTVYFLPESSAQFCVGENMNPDGTVALLDFLEDGITHLGFSLGVV